MRILIAMILAATVSTVAAQPADDRYVVRLDPAAAVDRVDAIAAQLAATHGASIVSTSSPADDTIVLRMPQARVTSLAADPRVRSVKAMRAIKVAADAKVVEPVDWTTGVNYSYDGSGAVTKIGADEFAYDDAGRLIRAKVNAKTRTYDYDAFGNRLGCLHEQSTDCQWNYRINSAKNQLVENSTTRYDDAGNLTDFGTHDYTYDAMNTMTSDQVAGARNEYLYSADDLRIATYNPDAGSWNWTLRDHSGTVIREFSSANAGTLFGTAGWTWTRDYVHRDGRLLASRFPQDGTVDSHHYHLDHLGSARRVTDSSEQIVGYHDYYAFGPEVSGSVQEPNASDLKYTGHEREPGSNEYQLDYMQARFYNPSLGRFLSPDPVLDVRRATMLPQVWNRYAYALNSPMTRIDPDGRTDHYFDPADDGNMIRLRVNVWYDTNTVNREYASGGGTVRSRMEQSMSQAQAFFARAGILLDFRRLDVDAVTNKGTEQIAIWTGDRYVRYADFAKTTPGLDIFVTQVEGRTGITSGRGGPTLIGNQVGPGTVTDELAHALGNTRWLLPFPNVVTDLYTDLNEWAVSRGKPMNNVYEMMLRGGAREVCQGDACK